MAEIFFPVLKNKLWRLAKRLRPAHALAAIAVFVVLFGVANKASAIGLSDMSSIYDPIMKLMTDILFLLVAGVAYVFSMSHILQWIISNPQWITITGQKATLVNAGVAFTTAFADMLLIVVFIAIAFGFVFKIETFESKKALPRFFAVAILAHFAPTIVAMIVDIANIVNNTLVLGSENAIVNVFNSLCWTMVASIFGIAKLFIGEAATLIIGPGVGDAAQFFTVTLLVPMIVPSLPIYFAQITISFLIGGMLMMYVIFFLSRIFMLQIIAIASPLAVVAYALPQTRSFYKQCWSALIQWAFVGTLVLFLLIIGLRSADSIMPGNLDAVSVAFGIPISIQGYLVYYLFLFIYMSVIAYIIDKNMPVMGSAIKSSFMGLAGMAMTHAVSPAVNNLNQRVAQRQENENRRVSQLKDADGNTIGEKALSDGERIQYNAGKAFTGAMGLATGLVNKPSYQSPITPALPRVNDRVNESMKLIQDGDSVAVAKDRLKIKTVEDFDSQKGAALIRKWADNPTQLNELQKDIGPRFFEIASSLAAKQLISKDQLTKAVGYNWTKLESKDLDATLDDKNMVNTYVPKGYNDDAYKRAINAGYEGVDAMRMAVMEGMVKSASKDTKNLDAYKLGEVVEKQVAAGQTQAVDATIQHTGKSRGKFMATMKPQQRGVVAKRVDAQPTEYFADQSPDLLLDKSVGNKTLFAQRKELRVPDLDKRGAQKINLNTKEPIFKDMTEPQRTATTAKLSQEWNSWKKEVRDQKLANAKKNFLDSIKPGQNT